MSPFKISQMIIHLLTFYGELELNVNFFLTVYYYVSQSFASILFSGILDLFHEILKVVFSNK